MIDRVNIAQQLSKCSKRFIPRNVNFTTEQPSHYINPHKLRDGIEGTCKTLLSYKEKGQEQVLDVLIGQSGQSPVVGALPVFEVLFKLNSPWVYVWPLQKN